MREDQDEECMVITQDDISIIRKNIQIRAAGVVDALDGGQFYVAYERVKNLEVYFGQYLENDLPLLDEEYAGIQDTLAPLVVPIGKG